MFICYRRSARLEGRWTQVGRPWRRCDAIDSRLVPSSARTPESTAVFSSLISTSGEQLLDCQTSGHHGHWRAWGLWVQPPHPQKIHYGCESLEIYKILPDFMQCPLKFVSVRRGTLVETMTFNRRVVGSTPALAATYGPWASPLPAVACALRRETPIQYPCCSRERL